MESRKNTQVRCIVLGNWELDRLKKIHRKFQLHYAVVGIGIVVAATILDHRFLWKFKGTVEGHP